MDVFEDRGGVKGERPIVHALPDRHHLPRLNNVFTNSPLYFLTCCAAGRRPILIGRLAARVLVDSFHASSTYHSWVVGRYVIMPDHVHFFARPCREAKRLSDFMRDWKKWTSRQLTETTAVVGPIWQHEFFDHLLRSAKSYSEKWEYVRQNPVRAGLAGSPEEWPHSGECELLEF